MPPLSPSPPSSPQSPSSSSGPWYSFLHSSLLILQKCQLEPDPQMHKWDQTYTSKLYIPLSMQFMVLFEIQIEKHLFYFPFDQSPLANLS